MNTFAGKHRAWTQVSGQTLQIPPTFAGIFGWSRTIEEPLAPGVQIAKAIRLKAVGQNPK
jgi:hypothetical protein